jgi:uncharacterized protein YaeQ
MLYRFKVELSDIDRNLYQSLDFRVAQNPSEALPYLLTRTLAYCLSYQEGLEFSPKGLGDPDGPALLVSGSNGNTDLWIEIGNPSARKLHRASKATKKLVVYTYKNVDALVQEIQGNEVHRADTIEIYSFSSKFLEELESTLEKNNSWSVLVQEGQVSVELEGRSIVSDLRKVKLKN